MRSEKVDIEEISSTKSEKWLTFILIVFVSMGAFWTYARIDNAVNAAIDMPQASMTIQRAETALDDATSKQSDAEYAVYSAQEELTYVREAYRTALEARVAHVASSAPVSDPNSPTLSCSGRSIKALRRCYLRANAEYLKARAGVARGVTAVERAQAGYDRLSGSFSKRVDRAEHERVLLAVSLRILLALLYLGCGYWLLAFLRRRRSRYLLLSYSIIVSGVLLCLVTAGDYENQYVGLPDVTPFALSLIGTGLTVLAFFFLQRFLARRVPHKRVRKGECPFCGFPARGGSHCEGCGREVVAECSTCGQERRVGTAFCASCGNA